MTRPYVPKAKFEPREDSILTATVHALGTSNWSDVAAALPGRIARQCRERWNNYANPNLNKQPWTSSEDSLLLEKYQELGTKWHVIAGFFNGRAKKRDPESHSQPASQETEDTALCFRTPSEWCEFMFQLG
jgi:hypothetical protein